MVVYKEYYSRGNVCAREFQNETLEKIAEKLVQIVKEVPSLSQLNLNQLTEFLDDEQYLGFKYSIHASENEVIITLNDRNLDVNYNSHGFDEIILTIKEKSKEEELIKKLKEKNSLWRVEIVKEVGGTLSGLFKEFANKRLTSQQLINLIKGIENLLLPSEDHRGYPSTFENPYNYAQFSWGWTEEGDEIIIWHTFPERIGCVWKEEYEEVNLIKVK